MKEDLSVGSIISRAMQDGIKNLLPVAVNYLLWMITIWIPYINIGTTIGVSVGLPAKAARGEVIGFTEVFNPEYRKQMGNYFLVEGLAFIGILIGLVLFIVPGIIIAIGWMLGTIIAVDQNENPLTALTRSNDATYGKKGTIFLGLLVLGIVISAIIGILSGVFGAFSEGLSIVVSIVGAAAMASFEVSAIGYIYRELDDRSQAAE